MPPNVLKGNRISGDDREALMAPDGPANVLNAQGTKKLTFVIKLCLSAGGVPTAVEWKKRTGFPEWDARIEAAIRQWRYKPYVAGGRAVPVCSGIVFNWSM